MALSAERNNDNYYVGNYFITPITKEEYQEILESCNNKETKLDHCHIVYMHNAPKNIISKYAKKVRESETHKDKNI